MQSGFLPTDEYLLQSDVIDRDVACNRVAAAAWSGIGPAHDRHRGGACPYLSRPVSARCTIPGRAVPASQVFGQVNGTLGTKEEDRVCHSAAWFHGGSCAGGANSQPEA